MLEFRFPDIGEGIHEGVLLRWFVKPGDKVKEGDSLCEMETDKVNAELPSPAEGIVKEIKGKVGDNINVGDVLVVIQTEEEIAISDAAPKAALEEIKKKPLEEGNAGVVGELEVSDELMSSSDEGLPEIREKSAAAKVLATPVARKMAYDLGIKIDELQGTGPSGRVMKADIQKAYDIRRGKEESYPSPVADVAPVAAVENKLEERVKLSTLRRTIARRMTESMFTIPHTVCYQDIDVTELVEYREGIKHLFLEEKGFSITYLPFIIKALILTLKKYPNFNSQLSAEGDYLIVKRYYDIGIAVDTNEGLMVPVIKSADKRSILELMEETVRLSSGARSKALKLEELKGSTFSITNFGAVGASSGAPIINYPEVAILGIGKIQQKPVVIDNEITIRWMLPISLAFDHRVVDGGDAGRFLQAFEAYIKEPDALLLQ